MKKYILIITICFSFGYCKSQFIDSIRLALESKPKLSVRFDNRYSFTATTLSKIIAIKIGAEFQDRFRIGGGYNKLNSRHTKPFYIESDGKITDTVTSNLKMSYMCYFIEYVFFRNKKWEFSIPLQLGAGNTHFEYTYKDIRYKNNRSFIINYEAGISGHYKIVSWFGVGSGIGFQLMLKDNPAITENFNTPVYSLRLKLFLGQVYNSVFRKKQE